ncbi:aminopeptidase N-like isoform X2 [Macrobrachium nipponense]|uniref:aminopeptidase N-like isoform X2 n=1 Tax=Macrobrachium nipponense TaxID=159736 RepID=UPI0030C8C8DF
MTGSSRETLSLETSQSAASVSFGKRNGCYVNRNAAVLFGLLFLSALIATGLLVYYYAPPARAAQSQTSDLASCPVPTEKPLTTSTSPAIVEEEEEQPKAKPYVRLPRSIKPLHYEVKLQPFINGNFSIMGYVEIEMEALMTTMNITVHMTDILTRNDTIKLAPLENREGPSLTIISHTYDNVRQFYIAHLSKPLQAGKKYVLSMEFDGYLNDKLYGFYRSTYTASDGRKVLLASTQFQPTDARRAFPCFDEPGLKATFDIYLGREANMSSLSNMPRHETLPIEGQPGWFWDHFNTSVPTSTYLVAFVISDFAHMNSTKNDHVLFRVWAREQAIKQADYALRAGPDVLTFFEKYFKLPFPLPKSDMIAIPDFSAGAMENWGLITYRETAMLYDPAVSSASNKQRVLQVVAHELAHQWFGNLVTPEWWTDLWLNEGFASFMEYVGSNSFEPSWKMMEQTVIEDVQNVFSLDCLESSHPISIPVNHPDEINEIFDRISYSKGSSIIRMMNYFLTPSTFTKGLSNYLTTLKYKNAEQDDLWRFLTEAGHGDGTLPKFLTVKKVMDTWTLQMGYPVIKVERSPSGTSASVTQERFLLVKNENSTDTHDYKWWVPLTYTSQDSPNFADTRAKVWMNDTESEIRINSLPARDKWVIFNLQETGYFRVNYDDNNWNLIVQQLEENHGVINIINRAQIIDDALDLARAGQLSYSTALSIIAYLAKETEYIPWVATLNNMGYLDGMFSTSGAYGSFKKYMLDLLIPLYNSVGFEDSVSDPHLTQLKRVRALMWACNLGYQDCVNKSLTMYRQWMTNPGDVSIISPNLKSVVYCTAISEGGDEEWNFAWEQYLNSNVASEKMKLLNAMGCSKDVWILSRYLKMAFTADTGIRKQDAALVFGSVARNKVGRYLAWNYLKDNWMRIIDYFGSLPELITILEVVSASFNTEQDKKELKMFKEEYKDQLKTAARAVDQAIEKTSNNIKWFTRNYDVITGWLESKSYSSRLRRD